jgi:hypothetical protein
MRGLWKRPAAAGFSDFSPQRRKGRKEYLFNFAADPACSVTGTPAKLKLHHALKIFLICRPVKQIGNDRGLICPKKSYFYFLPPQQKVQRKTYSAFSAALR